MLRSLARARLQQGHRTIAVSRRGAAAARPLSRPARRRRVQVPGRAAAPAPRPARPTPSRSTTRASGSTWAAACSAPTARRPAPRGPSATRRTTAWPRGRATTWFCDGETLKLAQALDEKSRRLFGRSLKLRQVSAGGCNALRGRPERARHRRLRPGPLRHPVRRLAAARRRPGRHRPGHREHAHRPCWRPTPPSPRPSWSSPSAPAPSAAAPYVDNPEVHNGCGSLLPVDLYIPGCPPHPLTILDGLLRLLGKL